MAITLGTNVTSLIAQGHLNSSSTELSKVMERLASGLKINRAGDDAAGLAISENMEAKIRGSEQALKNIQSATSFLNVAEDGMVSISDHMQRINDLLTNMANDTNDVTSRTASVNEIIERLDEINRLANTTNFNGRCMLDNTVQSIVVQMGPDSDLDSIIDIAPALSDCHTYASKEIDGKTTFGLDIELPSNLDPYLINEVSYVDDADADATLSGPLYQKTLGGQTVYYKEKPTEENPKPNYYTMETDLETGVLTIQEYKYDEATKAYAKEGTAKKGKAGSEKFDKDFDPTNENCRAYMQKIQDAIGKISAKRGLLGAYENRMESSANSMTTRIECLQDGKIVYTDADIAEESTRLSKQQILQQINVAMLTAANSNQQVALSLIGG